MFRWQDILDIVLNSYILFRLYVLFRGTNVFRVLIGIALLWFFQKLASTLGLIVSSWAIQGITAVGALIIVVIFRNEIRTVLQAKNFKAILWGFKKEGTGTPLEIIVDCIFDLAQRRVGALLVFPGKEDLKEVVHSGISWDAVLSGEMLGTIFWPGNPVHDGAAIIQGDRVTDVGVLLPLSRRTDLPSHYGTRHRAAAGLAETTDALVILVSEERGSVVAAGHSRIRAVKTKKELTDLLRKHLGSSEGRGGVLKRETFELGLVAMASLLFIAGVWFSFTKGLESLVELEVPVEYMNRDPGMNILNASVNSLRLGLIGSGPLIRTLRPDQVRVRLDLGKGAIGENTFSLIPENITLPPGVFLKNIKPDTLTVTLDAPEKKVVPLQVDWVGKLPDHLILSGIKLNPENAHVVAGREDLKGISTIYTKKVPLDKIQKSGTLSVGIDFGNPSLKPAPGSKETVSVSYTVTERQPVL